MNKKIALNTLFITSASFISKAIAYLYFIFLTKSFSPEKIGIFGLLVTSLLFMELFSGFGTDKILMRELSKGEKIFWWYSLIFRLVSSIIVFLIFIFIFKEFYKNLFNLYSREIFIFLSSIFFINVSRNIESYFIAKEKMIINSAGQIIEKLGILLSSFLVFYKFIGFGKFLYLFFLAEVITCLFYLFLFFKDEKFLNNFSFNLKKITFFFKESSSMFIIEIIAIIYFRIDIFMLSKMTDMKTTGLYHVAYKIFDFFITFFSGFLLAIFPYFSRKGMDINPIKYVTFGNIILIPVIILGILFKKNILSFFNPTYISASDSLLILLLTVPFVYANSLMVNYFIANGLQRVVIKLGIVLVCTNILLNFFLIPYFSLNGAAATTLFCEILLTGFFIYFYVSIQREVLKKEF